MSRLFGPLRQMGYVIPDVEAAMHHCMRDPIIGNGWPT
jgi:hypothetical protein